MTQQTRTVTGVVTDAKGEPLLGVNVIVKGTTYDNIDYVWGDKLDIGRVYSQWDPINKEYRDMELTSKGKNNFKNFLEFSMISNTTVSVSTSSENGSVRASLSYLYDKNHMIYESTRTTG